MPIDLGLKTGPVGQPSTTAHSRPLNEQVLELLVAQRAAHPELARGELEHELFRALDQLERTPIPTRKDAVPEVPEVRRMGGVTLALAVLLVIAMGAALFLIRRP